MTQANQEMVELVERVGAFMRAFIPDNIVPGSWPADHWLVKLQTGETLLVNDVLAMRSAIETLLKQQEEMREKAAALVSACDGLEWNSFTEAGWKRVNDLRASLTKPALEDGHNG